MHLVSGKAQGAGVVSKGALEAEMVFVEPLSDERCIMELSIRLG